MAGRIVEVHPAAAVVVVDLALAAMRRIGPVVESAIGDPPEDLVALARQWDLKFCINTDAHAPGQLEWQPYGCDKLAQLDIGADSVINTWSADELVEWANSR